LAVKTNRRYGHTKGQPVRFVRGHGRRLSGVPYRKQEMDYKTACWIWQRARTRAGYGQAFDGRMMRPAHRVYYEREYGEVPKGLVLDHLSRIRACINPAHLEPVTHAENVRRGKVTIADMDAARAVRVSKQVPDEPTVRFELTRDRTTPTEIKKSWCPGDGLFIELQGHRYRLLADDGESVPYGLCKCGCGNRTPVAKRNEYRRGHVKGEPIPVLHGHNRRPRPPHFRLVRAGHDSPCYMWNHGKTSAGYAQTSFGRSTKLVHRLTYEAANGTVPKGLELHHLCEHRDCMRPDHMVPLTHAEHARISSYAKLTMQAAREILVSTDTVANLAARHGVAPAAICEIRSGREWNEAII
jgi:HNH endonuclease